jgi:hypothetical protein
VSQGLLASELIGVRWQDAAFRLSATFAPPVSLHRYNVRECTPYEIFGDAFAVKIDPNKDTGLGHEGRIMSWHVMHNAVTHVNAEWDEGPGVQPFIEELSVEHGCSMDQILECVKSAASGDLEPSHFKWRASRRHGDLFE